VTTTAMMMAMIAPIHPKRCSFGFGAFGKVGFTSPIASPAS
jgi:hypothetical protein